jgi:hypothetical protein
MFLIATSLTHYMQHYCHFKAIQNDKISSSWQYLKISKILKINAKSVMMLTGAEIPFIFAHLSSGMEISFESGGFFFNSYFS